jgi:hypothetical protein
MKRSGSWEGRFDEIRTVCARSVMRSVNTELPSIYTVLQSRVLALGVKRVPCWGPCRVSYVLCRIVYCTTHIPPDPKVMVERWKAHSHTVVLAATLPLSLGCARESTLDVRLYRRKVSMWCIPRHAILSYICTTRCAKAEAPDTSRAAELALGSRSNNDTNTRHGARRGVIRYTSSFGAAAFCERRRNIRRDLRA